MFSNLATSKSKKNYLWIGRIFKLVKHITVSCFVQQLHGLLYNPIKAFSNICEVHLSAKSSKHYSSFKTIRRWHYYLQLIALDCCNECQTNASVTTGCLNEDSLQSRPNNSSHTRQREYVSSNFKENDIYLQQLPLLNQIHYPQKHDKKR